MGWSIKPWVLFPLCFKHWHHLLYCYLSSRQLPPRTHTQSTMWCCSQVSGASEAPKTLQKIPKIAVKGEVSPLLEAYMGLLTPSALAEKAWHASTSGLFLLSTHNQHPDWWKTQICFSFRTKIVAFFPPFSFLITASQAWKCYPALCNNPLRAGRFCINCVL